jgi:hypothetical protein
MRADEEEMFLFRRARAALGIVAKRPRAVLVLSACGLALAASRLAPFVSGLALTASGGGLVLSVVGHLFTLETRRYDRQKGDLESDTAYRESDVGRARMETDAILAAHVPPPIADKLNCYVPRLELEAALEAYLQQPFSASGTYLVAYGARGAGKSTLVKHVLSKSGAGIVVLKTGDAQVPDLDTLVVDTALKQHRAGQPGMYVPSEALKGQLYERLAQVTQGPLRGPPGRAALAPDRRVRRRQIGRQQAHRERV